MLLLVTFVLAAFVSITCVQIVPQNNIKVVERNGQSHKILYPGINIIIPIIDKLKRINWTVQAENRNGKIINKLIKTSKIYLGEETYKLSMQDVITRCSLSIEINPICIFFQIVEPIKAVCSVQDIFKTLDEQTKTVIKNHFLELDITNILTSQAEIQEDITKKLNEITNNYGIKICRVELIIPLSKDEFNTIKEKLDSKSTEIPE